VETPVPGWLIWICLHIGCAFPEPPAVVIVSQETLVHHVQTGMVYPCPAARERLAHGLRAQWLREAGAEDPYAAMGMDEFTILIRSICWPE
jgi:hypothetical protein